MSSASDRLAAAAQALRRGDVQGAEGLLAPLLAEAPSAEALTLMSHVQRARGALESAEAFARDAARADPARPERLGLVAALLQVQGRLDEACTLYRTVLDSDPGLDRVRLNLARCLVAKASGPEARAEAQALLAKNPQDAAALQVLSYALRLEERYEEALAAAERAMAAAPTTLSRLGRALARSAAGAIDDAAADFRALMQEGALSNEAALSAAHVFETLGAFSEAQAAIGSALTAAPDDETLLSTLCVLRWLAGEADFARPLLDALAAAPQRSDLPLAAARLLLHADQGDAAELVLRTALTRQPRDAPLHLALAVVLDEGGRAADALEAFDAALAIAPSDEARLGRAVALQRLGRPEESLEEINALRRRGRADGAILAREATALRQLGDPRYRRLYDYTRHVRAFMLAPPPGYATIEAFNEDLAAALRAMHRSARRPLSQSLRRGTQTGQNLADAQEPVIRAFLKAVQEPIARYVADLSDDEDDPVGRHKRKPYKVWRCWSVRLASGGHHVNHIHPDGWISSAYYVRLPEAVAGSPTRAGWIKFGEPYPPIEGLGPEHFIEPRPGLLALFPSYMWHGTVPFEGDERLTVAFDVAFTP